MQHQFFLIRAVSNLHVGSGDADFGIIDKHVQRDALTHLPTIHGSSLKGALRQLMETAGHGATTEIFGSENRGGANRELRQGDYLFYGAKILALPVRSSQHLYYLATCPALVQELLDDAGLYGITLVGKESLEAIAQLAPEAGRPIQLGNAAKNLRLEESYTAAAASPEIDLGPLEAYFGHRLVVFNESDFQELCTELPTVARNHLDNGISINLWYEEIVPRETRFYVPIGMSGNSAAALTDFLEKEEVNHLVQIGGNATVGYGLCTFKKLA